jgi:hypothetical protein
MEKLIAQSAVPLLTLLSFVILLAVGAMLRRTRRGERVGFDQVNGNPRQRGLDVVGSTSDVFDAGADGGGHGGGDGGGH